MKSIKTARGQTLDMSALAAKNEKTREISNVPVNARGDIIDNRGEVKVSKEELSAEFYKNHVPGADVKSVPVSEEPTTSKTKAKKSTPAEPLEINRTAKTRSDGSTYIEVEYDDGSMQELDMESDEGNSL